MTLNTYLHFNGNCREAFEFYRSVFGGEFLFIDTFANGPEDFEVPEAERDNIMHVSLPIGSQRADGQRRPVELRAGGHGEQLLHLLSDPEP